MAANLPRVTRETENDIVEVSIIGSRQEEIDLELLPVEDDEKGEAQLEEVHVAANRRDEIAALIEIDAFEPLDALGMEPGSNILPARVVDTEERSRFVAKDIATYTTDASYAPSSASPTATMIDLAAWCWTCGARSSTYRRRMWSVASLRRNG